MVLMVSLNKQNHIIREYTPRCRGWRGETFCDISFDDVYYGVLITDTQAISLIPIEQLFISDLDCDKCRVAYREGFENATRLRDRDR